MINEEGYKLGGSFVYSIYYKDGDIWKLFDSVTENDNIDKIKKYADIVSDNKHSDVVVIENNAPDNIPTDINNLNEYNIIYKNTLSNEIYDEEWIKEFNKEDTSENTFSIHETKNMLVDIFKEDIKKVISEDKFDDNFINVTMLIQKNPLIESSTLLMDYAERKYGEECIAEELAEIIEYKTGMCLYEFTKLMREKDTSQYSKWAHDWVDKQVKKIYPKHVSNKEEAFGIAWDQYKKHHN